MFGSSAEKEADISTVSMEKVSQFEKHPELIKALDSWMLIADKTLIPKLKELAKLVVKLYSFPREIELFRGFDLNSSYQDTLGLSDKGLFFNTIKDHKTGDRFTYENETVGLSFTTDRSIAEAFGKTVVKTKLDPRKQSVLVITPELNYVVCKRRNIPMVTQAEVIVLPPFKLQFEITLTNHKSPQQKPLWGNW